MAESTGDPPPEPDQSHDYWHKRIQGFIDSGQAAHYVQEGFAQASQGTFLDLEGFKKRESRGNRPEISQGQLHQGSTSGDAAWPPPKKLTGGHHNPGPDKELMHCRGKGKHDWKEHLTANVYVCRYCGLERSVSAEGAVQYKHATKVLGMSAVEEWLADEEEVEEASRICIWCGKVCDSIEALDAHEEECEP